MNTQYRKNLKAVLEASKTYCDESIDNLKWELGTYDLDTDSDTTTAYQKVVPSGSIEAKINTLGCMSYKINQLGNWIQESISISATIPEDNDFYGNLGESYIGSSKMISGHKYLVSIIVDNASNNFINARYFFGTYGNYIDATTSAQQIFTCNGTTELIRFYASDTNTCTFDLTIMVFDLTAMEIDTTSLDTAIAGLLARGINPYEYNAYESGSIRDTAPTSVKSVGFNIWDEETELGDIDGNTGENESATNRIRTKNYIRVEPSKTYYFLSPVSVSMMIYDINKIFLGYINVTANTAFTLGNNVYYVRFSTPSTYGTTYNHDICINISNASLNGTYKPYFTASLLIPAQVQALDGYGWGVNSTCYNYIDFNSKKFNRVVYKVDLSTLTFTPRGDGTFYSATDSSIPLAKENSNILSDKYSYGNPYASVDDNIVYVFVEVGRTTILVRDTSSGGNITGYLYYEQATPIETDISAYLTTNKITVEGGGALTMENTYGASVPSDVDYLIEEVKA